MKLRRQARPPVSGEGPPLLAVYDAEARTISLWRGGALVVPATRDLGALMDALGPPTAATETLAHTWFTWLTTAPPATSPRPT
jgi:hypothetical protein